jgi:hypothetical protein
VHWCLGMRSSGSTWIFNVVRKLAELLHPDWPIAGPYVVRGVELPPFDAPSRYIIVKTHRTDDLAMAKLAEHANAICVSIRDPRDCVASLVRYHAMDFAAALEQVGQDARYCSRIATHPRASLFRYEACFPDAPATIEKIASTFGAVLPPAERDRIFAETRRPVIEAFIQQLDQLPRALRPAPDDLVDPVTKWHRHHANRTGEIGRWNRELTASQVAQIVGDLGDWMDSFGYSTALAPQGRQGQ